MRIPKFILHIFTAIQIASFAAVLLLENLYGKKMGVTRYIQFKNLEFKELLFSNTFLMVYTIIFIISSVASIFLLVKSKPLKSVFAFNIIISFLGLYFTSFANIDNIKALYFFIIASLVSLIIQLVKIFNSCLIQAKGI